MALFKNQKKKNKELLENELKLIKVTMDNGYKKDVLAGCKKLYLLLLEKQKEDSVDEQTFRQILIQINTFTKGADEKYYPIETNYEKI